MSKPISTWRACASGLACDLSQSSVTALDPDQRLLSVAGRPPLAYDLLSLDIGSQPELDSVPGAREHAVPVKPVAGLWQNWQRWQEEIDGQEARIAVVGGGAGSIELVMAMANCLAGRQLQFALYCGALDILPEYNRRARAAVSRGLECPGHRGSLQCPGGWSGRAQTSV